MSMSNTDLTVVGPSPKYRQWLRRERYGRLTVRLTQLALLMAVLDGTGDSYSWAGLAHRRGQGEPDRGQYDDQADVFGVCGAAAVYRGSAIATVGEFDAQLQAYCEDTDWCFRARLAGYGCRFVPSARVYHIGSAALGLRATRRSSRNRTVPP